MADLTTRIQQALAALEDAALAFRWMPLSTMPALHYEAFWGAHVAYRQWEKEAPKWPT